MNKYAGLVFGCLAGAGVLAASPAHALEAVQFGVGLFGGGGVVGVSKPDDTTYTSPGGSKFTDTTYPGFVGPAFGGGIALEARFVKYLGLEIDFIGMSERGTGDLTITNGAGVRVYTIKIEQTSLRVPILAKAMTTTGPIAPFFVLGPELVFPGKTTATVDPIGLATNISASASSYVLVTAGFGLEIKLPTPGVDLRIPFSIRASINPASGNSLSDRARMSVTDTGTLTAIEYDMRWKYQGMATLGLSAFF